MNNKAPREVVLLALKRAIFFSLTSFVCFNWQKLHIVLFLWQAIFTLKLASRAHANCTNADQFTSKLDKSLSNNQAVQN